MNLKAQIRNLKRLASLRPGVFALKRSPGPDRRVPTPVLLGLMFAAVALAILAGFLGRPVQGQSGYPYGRAATVYEYAGVPTNGASGTLAKIARKGALLTNTTNNGVYQNQGTQASPTWVSVVGAIGAGAVGTTELAAGGVTSAKMADDLAHTIQVSVSSADILGLNSTPKSLIAAPGSGKVIIVEGIVLKMVRSSTAYANGGALEFRYTNASGAKVSADMAATVVTTGGAGTEYNSVAGVTTSLTPVANAAIVMDNATAAFITGTGTAVVSLKYRIVTP